MHTVSSLGMTIMDIIQMAFRVYWFLIIARIILSWVQIPYNPVVKFIYEVTEPFLGIFRKIIPPVGMIDLSPIVALFALHLLELVVMQILRYII